MYVHAWKVHLRRIRLSVCDLEYQVLQSALVTANVRKSNCQKIFFFLFQHPCTSMHGRFIYVVYGSQFVTLNIKFCSLHLLRLMSGNPTVKRFFFFFFNIWLLRFDYCVYFFFHFGEVRNITKEAL